MIRYDAYHSHPKKIEIVGIVIVCFVVILLLLNNRTLYDPVHETVRSVSSLEPYDICTNTTTTTTITSTSTSSSNDVSYKLAYEESYGFFDDIEDSVWMLQKQKANRHSLFKYRSHPNYKESNIPLWMLNNVDPIFTCPHVERLGAMGDGGKWTCDPHRLTRTTKPTLPETTTSTTSRRSSTISSSSGSSSSSSSSSTSDCLVYSIGCAGKYDFEDALSDLTNQMCEIHVFDPNPRFVREGDIPNKNITYHPWGIVSSYRKWSGFRNFEFRTLPQTLRDLGHDNGRRHIDVFKIDCEGCEWTTYKDWLGPNISIGQILIELHPASAINVNVSIATFFQDMDQAGFVPFSKEANTHPAAKPPLTLFEMGFVRLQPSFRTVV